MTTTQERLGRNVAEASALAGTGRFDASDNGAGRVERPSRPGAAGAQKSMSLHRSSRRDSEYADVVEKLRRVRDLPTGSAQYQSDRDCIVRRCLPLAENIAHRYRGRGQPREDLVQVARLGLVKAVDRFDVEAGTDFISFAVPTIMGEVRRYFRDSGWSVKVPRRLKDLDQRIGTAINELSQHFGRAPTATELADELDVERSEVVQGLIAGDCYQTLSLDLPASREDAGASTIADRLGETDNRMEFVENREALRPLFAALPERERAILIMRFFESLTQTEIASRIGVSQMHVSRLLARALTSLRNGLLYEI